MQKVWISKARAALDQPATVKVVRKPVVEKVPVREPEPEPVIELKEPEPQQKQPPKAIPTMLFQEPS